MHAFMHTLLSLIVMGISIQGLGTGTEHPGKGEGVAGPDQVHLAKQQAAAEITFQKLTICLVFLIDVTVNIDIPLYLCQNMFFYIVLHSIIKGSLVANFRYTNFWVAWQQK